MKEFPRIVLVGPECTHMRPREEEEEDSRQKGDVLTVARCSAQGGGATHGRTRNAVLDLEEAGAGVASLQSPQMGPPCPHLNLGALMLVGDFYPRAAT